MTYGVPHGSQINYGTPGFPEWVYQLGQLFGLKASTYPGHQENNRNEAGYAPNPQLLNRGIDWAGPVANMQRFAEYCFSIRGSLEQVIWQNPQTGQRIGVAGGKDVTNTPYFASDYGGHTDHVHTRQSEPIPFPGGATPAPIEPSDTIYADVSEWQRPVDDSYPYRVIAIRSNDGSHRDKNWAANYAWCKRAADDGRLTCFIVYYYWRPGIDSVAILQEMVGVAHPKMAVMIDVESGGNPRGNFSSALNADNLRLAQWLGDERRVIAYANLGDLNALWPDRREDQLVIAAYGSNPSTPGKIAHQYTDGQGYGGGLPEGCPPFGNCDMNSADGYTPTAFAAALGISTSAPTTEPPIAGDDDMAVIQVPKAEWDRVKFLIEQVSGIFRPSTSMLRHAEEGVVNTCAGFARSADGLTHPPFTDWAAGKGHVDSIALCLEVASADLTKPAPDGTPGRTPAEAQADAALADTILADAKAANPDRFNAALAQIEATKPDLLQQYINHKKGA